MDSSLQCKLRYFVSLFLFLQGVLGGDRQSDEQVGINQTVPGAPVLLSSDLSPRDSTEDFIQNDDNRDSPLHGLSTSTSAGPNFTKSFSRMENADVDEPTTIALREKVSVDETNLPWNATTAPFPFGARGETSRDRGQRDMPDTTYTVDPTTTGESTPTPWNSSSFPLNLPKNFCTGSLVVQTWCYCDEFCILFQDCCFDCKEPLPSTGVRLNPNNIECLLQSNVLFKGLQSQHFWMVTSCPEEWPYDTVRSKCEGPRNTSETDRLVPVSDLATNLVFHNKHCAMCHGISTVQQWDFYITCAGDLSFGVDRFFNFTHTDDIVEQTRSTERCALLFHPPPNVPGRPCIPTDFMPIMTTSSGVGVTRQCQRDANPEHKQHCSSGPISVVRFPLWSVVYYGRNIFCWLCRLPKGYVPDITQCSDQGMSRSFDPLGYSVMIDPSEARYKKPCEESRNQGLCHQEEDQCFTPIRHMFNTDFPIYFALVSENRANFTSAEGICGIGLHYLFHIRELKALRNRAWVRLRSPTMCTEVAHNATISSPVSVFTYRVRLTKMIRGYREGIRMFASFQNEVSKELRDRDETVTYNGIEYRVTVLMSGMARCPGSVNTTQIPTPPTGTHGGDNGGTPSRANERPRSNTLAYVAVGIAWGIFAFHMAAEV